MQSFPEKPQLSDHLVLYLEGELYLIASPMLKPMVQEITKADFQLLAACDGTHKINPEEMELLKPWLKLIPSLFQRASEEATMIKGALDLKRAFQAAQAFKSAPDNDH